MSDMFTDAYDNKTERKYNTLLQKEKVDGKSATFWAYNAIFGEYGKGKKITPEFIQKALETKNIIVSQELAQAIINIFVENGFLSQRVGFYLKNATY